MDTYGWEWLEALARQDVHFHRGTNTPGEAVDAGLKRVGLAGAASGGAGTTWSTPDAGHPSSPGASARHCSGTPLHPEAAKLVPELMLSRAVQASGFNGWNVRTDVVPEGGPI
ncbi:hypothetical protein [Streptomyces sp. KL116D]|uniref:hypothetical protein n=1 Tax=Streptomyces sp. KL116D TaxID=3045152 RepID=UPI003557C2D7